MLSSIALVAGRRCRLNRRSFVLNRLGYHESNVSSFVGVECLVRCSFSSSSSSPLKEEDVPTFQNTLQTANSDNHAQNDSLKESDARTVSLKKLALNLEIASQYSQENSSGGRSHDDESNNLWDVDFVRRTVEQYEACLIHFYNNNNYNQVETNTSYEIFNDVIRKQSTISITDDSPKLRLVLLSSETAEHAFRAMLRCKIATSKLSQKVRDLERYLGKLGQTPLTDNLSLQMLEANGKAGNVGRAIALLSLRQSRGYDPKKIEFVHAVRAIEAAGLSLRKNRNVFLPDKLQPSIDNPTRWLDSILLNMSQRGFPLTTKLANYMLNTFASTGKTGKALHFFYRVRRSPVADDHNNHDEGNNNGTDDKDPSKSKDLYISNDMAHFRNQPVKIRLSMRPPPPYHKVPSQVRGKLVQKPGTTIRQLKLDREMDPDWSIPLSAAIAFADSLEQGACGHDPIKLDTISYTTLIKTCVNRGSLWRAMHILDTTMPSNGVEPDVVSYNTVLMGLARVGDVPMIREYFQEMIAKDIKPTHKTVEAIVHGLLNLGDVPSAITVVQDIFNQYSVLPPYTTHLKILEFALGTELKYEAKRHVYFIQQLWKWEPNEYHSNEFVTLMENTKGLPQLSKAALQKLFAYFGERLDDSDFF